MEQPTSTLGRATLPDGTEVMYEKEYGQITVTQYRKGDQWYTVPAHREAWATRAADWLHGMGGY